VNIWDSGYPSGGNYWSDYNGTDLYSGPYQNKTGSDYIGDIPHVIGLPAEEDNYPLMIPYDSVTYEILQRYIELRMDYNNLQASYNELQLEQEDTIDQLNNIQNLMYVFVAVSAVLIIATGYLGMKTTERKKRETLRVT